LLSSIMTYGTLGENYELVAIKAAGISLTRALYPMVIVVTMLSIGAFVFSDYMLPVANLKFLTLLYDVRQQKSASLIKINVFNNSFPGYSIRVGGKSADDHLLYNVMIYEKNPNPSIANNTVTFAKEGEMFKSPDNKFLILKLRNGIRWDEEPSNNNGYNQRQTLTRFKFKETDTKMSLAGFGLRRTNDSLFKGEYRMLSSHQLKDAFYKLRKAADSILVIDYSMIVPDIKYLSLPHKPVAIEKTVILQNHILETLPIDRQISAVTIATSEAVSAKNTIKVQAEDFRQKNSDLRRYQVEYQKKFTLSVACLVLFLIGAPLGAIIRKGGLGLPIVISVVFFLIYHIISTIGEKSAKDGSLSPFLGAWMAILILAPVGVFLSYKAANDSVLFDMEVYKRFFSNLFKTKAV